MPNSYDNLMKYGATNVFAIMVCAFTVPAAKLSAELVADKYGHNEETWGLIGTAVGLSPLAFTLLLTAYGWMKDCRLNGEVKVNEEQASLLQNDELSTNFEMKESPRQSLSLFNSYTKKFGLPQVESEKELGGLRPDFNA